MVKTGASHSRTRAGKECETVTCHHNLTGTFWQVTLYLLKDKLRSIKLFKSSLEQTSAAPKGPWLGGSAHRGWGEPFTGKIQKQTRKLFDRLQPERCLIWESLAVLLPLVVLKFHLFRFQGIDWRRQDQSPSRTELASLLDSTVCITHRNPLRVWSHFPVRGQKGQGYTSGIIQEAWIPFHVSYSSSMTMRQT